MQTNKTGKVTGTETSAVGTGLGSQVRTDLNYIDASLQSLVFDETLQLEEAPTIKPSVKPLTHILIPALSYPFKVLQYDCVSTAADDLFADVMIDPTHVTILPTRDCFEQSLGRLGAFTLKSLPQILELHNLSLMPSEHSAITTDSEVVYSDINTDLKSVRNLVDINVSGECDVQEHSVMLINGKQGSLWTPIKILPIISWNFDGNINPTINSGEPNLVGVEGEGSLVKSQRQTLFKSRFASLVSFDRLEGLGSNTISIYHKLRRQVKLLSGFVIAEMMKAITIVSLGFKTSISDIRNSLAILFHSIKKQPVERDFELDCNNRLHRNYWVEQVFKTIGGKAFLLPTINGLGIRNARLI